ncbi:hypothetical protein E2C01_085919 [Portunus trituberculatus]|uniref:Uncharacterized protein n=1 Tax=Portunus trituberculatus TaxID=210409 RepID=A0A5B7J8B0_PORTR|nr:hypothetical protein [Portunus trituberculatus]
MRHKQQQKKIETNEQKFGRNVSTTQAVIEADMSACGQSLAWDEGKTSPISPNNCRGSGLNSTPSQPRADHFTG